MKLTNAALFAAFGLLALPALTPAARAQKSEPFVIKAQGKPQLLNFMVLVNKRADLRLAKARHGVDVAFTNWLRNERPHVYQQYAKAWRAEQAKRTAQKEAAELKGGS